MTPPIDPPIDQYTHPWVGGVSTNHKSSNRIELSQLDQDLIFSNMTWPHPLTHCPSNNPYLHPWVGVSVQIINLQTELNYLD